MEPGAKLPHWAGLDGVRGLAVAAVLAFHGGLAWARGGFLGVSLFFTLSGFLITSIVVREREATGHISLGHFWARRARRLLPASLLTLALAMVVTVVIVPAGQQAAAFGDVRAAALNLANWRFISQGQVYADATALPSPVQHYWSLAIEEQFYLVFPVLALVALRWRRAALGTVFVLVIAWSLRQQLTIDDRPRVYFGTDARAAELAVGGLLALGHARIGALLSASRRHIADLLGVAGLAATLLLWWQVPNTSAALHRGGFVGVAMVSALVVLGAVDGDRVPRALSARPLTALGLVSYGVYLFHFPLFLALDSPRVPLDGTLLLVAKVLVTLAVAAASFVVVERPVRRGTLLRGHQSTLAFVGSLGLVVLVTVGGVRHYDGTGSSELAGGVLVTLGGEVDASAGGSRAPHIVLVGDSTAAAMGRGLESWGASSGRVQVTTVAAPGCATYSGTRFLVRTGYTFVPKGCDELFTTAASVAAEQGADALVVMMGSTQLADWEYDGADGWHDVTEQEIQQAYRTALDRALDQLELAGVPVLWADVPLPDWDVDLFARSLGRPIPGEGPAVLNDPERVAIVNDLDAEIVPRHGLVEIWSLAHVMAGPDGRIPDGLRFDGLHVDEGHVPALADGPLLRALDEAYDAVVARSPAGLHPPGASAWAGP